MSFQVVLFVLALAPPVSSASPLESAAELVRVAREERDYALRRSAVMALGERGAEKVGEVDLVAALREVMAQDADSTVRQQAALALSRIARSVPEARERIFELGVDELGKAEGSGAESALELLSELRDPRAIEPLIAALQHPQVRVREYAPRALSVFSGDRRILAPLMAAVARVEPYGMAADFAQMSLERILDREWERLEPEWRERSIVAFLRQLRSESPRIRRSAALFLVRALPPLVERHPESRLAELVKQEFQSLPSQTPEPQDRVRSGVLVLFELIFFGGLPLLHSTDAVGRAQAVDVAPWAPERIEAWCVAVAEFFRK